MAEIKSKVGYAIVSFGKIDIRTVGPTRRSAIINWLVTTANIMVYRHHNDEQVEMLWRGTKGRDHEVVEVDIAVRPRELCIDCMGCGQYPSGASCKSCDGTGLVGEGDGIAPAVIGDQS